MIRFVAIASILCTTSSALADEAVERRLHVAMSNASSFLWNDWNRFQENYHSNYIVDGDPKTAWVEGVEGDGIGEWVQLPVTELDATTEVRLRIQNGYQKSKNLYRANARPKIITVELTPSGATKQFELKDERGWQEITMEQAKGPLRAVTIRIGAVYPGTRYTDTCISDVELYATSSAPENPSFERSKRERLLAWKKSRVEAARRFKNQKRGSSPIAPTGYRTRYIETGEKACGDDRICALLKRDELSDEDRSLLRKARVLMTEPDAHFRPAQAISKSKQELPPVDGLIGLDVYTLGELGYIEALTLPKDQGYLNRETIGFFDTKDQTPASSAYSEQGVKGCGTMKPYQAKRLSWVHTEKDSEGREVLSALLMFMCAKVESREGFYVARIPQLLVFGPNGRLRVHAMWDQPAVLQWRGGEQNPRMAAAHKLYYPDHMTSYEEVVRTASR